MLFARDGTDAKNCARDIRSFMAMITCTLSISVQLTPALNNKHDDDATHQWLPATHEISLFRKLVNFT